MKKAKRRINKFDFSAEGSHVALVSDGANEQEVLLMKSVHTTDGQTPLYEISEKEIGYSEYSENSDEVKITTSMQLFLQHFFGLWREDAANLASVLGYSSNKEWFEAEYGTDINVELLKSIVEKGVVSQQIYDVVKSMEDKHGDTIKNLQKEKERMDEKEIQKAIDDAIAKALAAKETEFQVELDAKEAELEKSKQTIEDLAKSVEKQEKDQLTEVIKGYSFVENIDDFVDTIFKFKTLDGFNVILDTLEKAQTAITAAVTVTDGIDGDNVAPVTKGTFEGQMSTVSEILKKRKENK